MRRPAVLIVTRRTIRKNKYVDYAGEYHLELLVELGLRPLMIPVVEGMLGCLDEYADEMQGLLLVEGEDIEPSRFKAQEANYAYLDKTHPLKDEIEIHLLQIALRRNLPVLGICRGSQLLNVVCGGTLYGDVRKEKKSPLKHIDFEHYDTYRHPVNIVPQTPLARWYRRKSIDVNSYHHQGVRTLASGFKPMARAEDGLIEAFYDPKADFRVGLQFHPERMLNEYPGNWRVWQSFGVAVHKTAGRRASAA